MESVSDRIKIIRKRYNLTQAQFADAIGISRGYLPTLEKDPDKVNDRIIMLISSAFMIRQEWLRTGEGPMRPQLQPGLNDGFVNIVESLYQALKPSGTLPDDFIDFLSCSSFSSVINYFCHRMKESPDQKEALRIAALLPVAFPDFVEVTDKLLASVSQDQGDPANSPLLLRSATIRPAGRAAAGVPVFDSNSDEITIAIPEKFLDTRRFKYIEVKGDSMEPRILSGDYVVVAVDVLPEPGEIALFYMNDHLSEDGYVIKRYQRSNGAIHLISLNPNYPPIELLPKQIHKMEKIVYVAHAVR
jgi:phage repressor protein C with HTH and peptisase S24 domain